MNDSKQMLKQSNWVLLKSLSSTTLDLERTLLSGQCFNWYTESQLWPKTISKNDRNIFIGVLNNQVIGLRAVFLNQHDPCEYRLEYCVWSKEVVSQERLESLSVYLLDCFQLNLFDLEQQMSKWAKQDNVFSFVCQKLPGLRVIKQEPFECFVSYICSQNNNFARIQKIIENIRKEYGSFIGLVQHPEAQGDLPIAFYSFPTFEQFQSRATEENLRNACGLGYRARYIKLALEKIKANGEVDWLAKLKGKDYEVVQKELCQFTGIGKKVADCIALFGLEVHDAIGIDTHVLQMTKKFYPHSMNGSTTLTEKAYTSISKFYKEKFGPYAGWAANHLFSAGRSLKLAKDPKISLRSIGQQVKISKTAQKRGPQISLEEALTKTLKKLHR